jgi:uncharacterized protein YecE (DUF72 family)
MQNSLFSDIPEPPDASAEAHGVLARERGARARGDAQQVQPQAASPEDVALAARLPREVRLGTSSWGFPGWAGLVWDREYSQTQLARQGLPAYARHPLLRTVSLDRAFYRPLSASDYADLARQVPDDFRFVVKAPNLVTDAVVRGENGRGTQANPLFLDPESAARDFVQPAIEGLGAKIGALVFQLSPLPGSVLARMPELLERLSVVLRALPSLGAASPDGVVAVEVRNAPLICPELAHVLGEAGATYCLGLHAKMPPIEAQLPMLRALWPGPLVCRWNLHRRHGAYGYEDAKDLYAPFDRLVDPDLETRAALTRVAVATARAGHPVYVTINNKAEGSAPLSVAALAEAVAAGA